MTTSTNPAVQGLLEEFYASAGISDIHQLKDYIGDACTKHSDKPLSVIISLAHQARISDNFVAQPASELHDMDTGQPTADIATQQSRDSQIRAFSEHVIQTHFLPGAKDGWFSIQGQALKGTNFDRYKEALRTVEWTMAELRKTDPMSPDAARTVKGACETLNAQAQSFLNKNSGALGRLIKSESDVPRKLEFVREGIGAAHRLSLAMDVLLGDVPRSVELVI